MNDYNIEKLKIIHKPLIDEINRYRDWPIRILTFTSAFYFGLIGLLLLKKIVICTLSIKIGLTVAVVMLYFWTVYYIGQCHLNYLKARNIQTKIQKKLELDKWQINKNQIFPDDWFTQKKIKLCTRLWGYGFYILYITILFVISILVIWVGTKFIPGVV